MRSSADVIKARDTQSGDYGSPPACPTRKPNKYSCPRYIIECGDELLPYVICGKYESIGTHGYVSTRQR